jgi:hypothetical protein
MLSYAFSAPTREKVDVECIASYLKEKGVLETYFRYNPPDEFLKCNELSFTLSKNYLNDTYADYTVHVTDTEDNTYSYGNLKYSNSTMPYAECSINQYEPAGIIDILSKKLVYTTIKKLSRKQERVLLEKLQNDLVKSVQLIEAICAPEIFSGTFFDEKLQEIDNDHQTDYCIRQYLVDKKLIDPKVTQINMNPHGIRTGFDCTYKVENYLDKMEKSVQVYFERETRQPRHQVRCIGLTIQKHNTADYLTKVTYLNAGTDRSGNGAEEKQKFAQFMLRLFKDLLKCSTQH